MRLGLAYVATGAEEPPAVTAIAAHRETEEPLLRARRERILAEIEQLGEHDWAGIYSMGDGLGVNVTLAIAPQAGATYTWNGCLGLYDLNHGDIVEVASDRITLDLAIDPAQNKRWGQTATPQRTMSDEWIVVRWGEERYMVPTAQMIDFCNTVSRGGWGSDFPRRNAERGLASRRFAKPLVGLPEVPPEYRPFLLTEPLTGSILTREEPRVIGTFGGGKEKALVRAQIDLGLRDGLLPGMLIDADIGLLGVVGAVEEQTATVDFLFAAWRNGPMPGWSIRTGPRTRGTR
jgi:hypothetical protein